MAISKRPKRASNTYPPHYMKIFVHVLQTGKPFRVDTLGKEKGAYVNFRQSVNNWRKAMSDEGNRLASDFYGLTVSLGQDEKGHYAIIRPREGAIVAGLEQLDIPEPARVADPAPQSEPSVLPSNGEPELPASGAKSISSLFGSDSE